MGEIQDQEDIKMGWTGQFARHFDKNGKIDRKAEMKALTEYWFEDGNCEIIKDAWRGTTYYAAVKDHKRNQVLALIVLTRTADGREILSINACDTMKEAQQTADYWNEEYKKADCLWMLE